MNLFARLFESIRDRWHPLWRLRQIPAFRRLQRSCDRTVYAKIPETGLRVAVKLIRDARWIIGPASVESGIRRAFVVVLDLLRPTTFWDIGANVGFYSWFVRRHSAIQNVVLFEPDPTNFALLLATIRKNAIADCQAMNVAVSDREGEASFLVDDASGATGALEFVSQRQNTYSLHHAYQMHETTTCRVATIDGLISEGVPAPQLIKIDVEGAEHLVLAGADSCLAERRPTIIMETANAELVRRLVALGYIAYRIDGENMLFVADTGGRDLAPLDQAFARCDLAP